MVEADDFGVAAYLDLAELIHSLQRYSHGAIRTQVLCNNGARASESISDPRRRDETYRIGTYDRCWNPAG